VASDFCRTVSQGPTCHVEHCCEQVVVTNLCSMQKRGHK